MRFSLYCFKTRCVSQVTFALAISSGWSYVCQRSRGCDPACRTRRINQSRLEDSQCRTLPFKSSQFNVMLIYIEHGSNELYELFEHWDAKSRTSASTWETKSRMIALTQFFALVYVCVRVYVCALISNSEVRFRRHGHLTNDRSILHYNKYENFNTIWGNIFRRLLREFRCHFIHHRVRMYRTISALFFSSVDTPCNRVTSLHFVIGRCLRMHCPSLTIFFQLLSPKHAFCFYEMYIHIYVCACINVYVRMYPSNMIYLRSLLW